MLFYIFILQVSLDLLYHLVEKGAPVEQLLQDHILWCLLALLARLNDFHYSRCVLFIIVHICSYY